MEIERESKPENTLAHLRGCIDQVDTEILSLLAKRVRLVRRVGEAKREEGLPIIDRGREADKIRSLVEKGNKIGVPADEITGVWNTIFQSAYEIET